jgi:hypothetical protein
MFEGKAFAMKSSRFIELECRVDDEKRRAALVAQAVRHDGSSGDIVTRVREINALAIESGQKKALQRIRLVVLRPGPATKAVIAIARSFVVLPDSRLREKRTRSSIG